jgi:Flp pilus assembly protein TadG
MRSIAQSSGEGPGAGSRTGALTLEAALVFPVFVLLQVAIILGGTGIFRYQQTACLAREAAHWASVRGGDYERDTEQTSPTKADIWTQAIVPCLMDIDASQLTLKVEWIDKANNQVVDWDAAPKDVRSLTALGEYVTNSVRVTVTFQWTTGLFGNRALSSVSEWPMSF